MNKNTKIKLNPEQIEYLKNNYNNLTLKDMGEYIGVSRETVKKILKELDINRDVNLSSKYRYNKYYFKNIDNEHKAYWLGFISADGCVADRGDNTYRLKIALSVKDFVHLEKFNNDIDGNLEIKLIDSKLNQNIHKSCLITVNCSEMVKDLVELGVCPNKTYDIELPNIDNDLIKHYLRGFIDGDGCLYINTDKNGRLRYSIELVGASIKILEQISYYLSVNGIKSSIYNKRLGNWKLMILSKQDILNFIDLIYNNASIYLDRKYSIAMEMNKKLAV